MNDFAESAWRRSPLLQTVLGAGVRLFFIARSALRSYLAEPRIHQGPAFEWFDCVYALVLAGALLALWGWRL